MGKWARDNRSKSYYNSDKHIFFRYGLTREDWNRMLDEQGGVCAICSTDDWGGRSDKPCVDHDHKTGQVRGLLCHACNRGLGSFADDVTLLDKASTYLQKWEPAEKAALPPA